MIKRYTKDDIKDIIALEEETLGTTLGEVMLEMELENPLANIFVDKDNILKGYVSTTFDGCVVEIMNICVNPKYQHQHIGSNIMNFLFDFYGKLNAESFFLEVRNTNFNAINFYLKHGFKEEYKRKGYYSNGDDAIVMIKKL